MTIKIKLEDTITLFDGKFKDNPIYYMVTYNNCSPRVIILNKNKFDLLLRKRETISFSEKSFYFKCCEICVTTFSDRSFEPQQKTKARHVSYY